MATSYSLSPYDNVGSGITRSGALKFPSPWFDIASESIRLLQLVTAEAKKVNCKNT